MQSAGQGTVRVKWYFARINQVKELWTNWGRKDVHSPHRPYAPPSERLVDLNTLVLLEWAKRPDMVDEPVGSKSCMLSPWWQVSAFVSASSSFALASASGQMSSPWLTTFITLSDFDSPEIDLISRAKVAPHYSTWCNRSFQRIRCVLISTNGQGKRAENMFTLAEGQIWEKKKDQEQITDIEWPRPRVQWNQTDRPSPKIDLFATFPKANLLPIGLFVFLIFVLIFFFFFCFIW